MNWSLLVNLLSLLCCVYIWLFTIVDTLAVVLYYWGKRTNFFWKLVRIYRFIRPARYFMLVLGTVVYSIIDWRIGIIHFIVMGWIFFTDKDNFDDDPRDKKTSKISSLVKSIGHRLVTVPT